VNSAIEECTIGDLAAIVLDEIHMLDDDSRGYLLELMVTKLLLLQQDIQIIGMSATISVSSSIVLLSAQYTTDSPPRIQTYWLNGCGLPTMAPTIALFLSRSTSFTKISYIKLPSQNNSFKPPQNWIPRRCCKLPLDRTG
jgi:hypothetical protein